MHLIHVFNSIQFILKTLYIYIYIYIYTIIIYFNMTNIEVFSLIFQWTYTLEKDSRLSHR